MKKISVSLLTLALCLTGASAQAACSSCTAPSPSSPMRIGQSADVPGATLVKTGRNSGYYLVCHRSDAVNALGLQRAPYVSGDASSNGVGLDSIAFRFGADGKLEELPVYIHQLPPDAFYTAKLQALSRGYSTLAQVQQVFADHVLRVEKQGSQTVAYLEVPVYNPLVSGS